MVGKVRFQALSACCSSSQEKNNPPTASVYRKSLQISICQPKRKKKSQQDSVASVIGNGGAGWLPAELSVPKLVLNLTALPLDGIQVSRRWQGCHSLSPSGCFWFSCSDYSTRCLWEGVQCLGGLFSRQLSPRVHLLQKILLNVGDWSVLYLKSVLKEL